MFLSYANLSQSMHVCTMYSTLLLYQAITLYEPLLKKYKHTNFFLSCRPQFSSWTCVL